MKASYDEVYDQVRKRIDIFGENGGFVFNAVHNLQAKTPVENLLFLVVWLAVPETKEESLEEIERQWL